MDGWMDGYLLTMSFNFVFVFVFIFIFSLDSGSLLGGKSSVLGNKTKIYSKVNHHCSLTHSLTHSLIVLRHAPPSLITPPLFKFSATYSTLPSYLITYLPYRQLITPLPYLTLPHLTLPHLNF